MEQQERQEALEIGEKLGSEPLASGAASTDHEPVAKADAGDKVQQPVESDEEDDSSVSGLRVESAKVQASLLAAVHSLLAKSLCVPTCVLSRRLQRSTKIAESRWKT